MSVNAIEKALWQSCKNPADAKRFREDAHAYLKEFRVDEVERWLMAEWDVSGLIEHGVHPMIIMMAFVAVNGGASMLGYQGRLHPKPETYFPGRFAGKVAVVTGAAQGIGFETAKRLGLEGASVVVADAAEGPAHDAVKHLERLGIAAVSAVGDLSTLMGAQAAMQRARDVFGGLDILVNNVGGAIWMKPFWHFSEDEMHAEVDRTLWPTMMCCHAAVSHFRERGGGVIVNIGSNAATEGVYRIPYSASKGAVISLTQSLAVELGCLNIRVNCVSPGGTVALGRKTPRGTDQPPNKHELEWMSQFIKLVTDEELIPELATVKEQAAVIAFMASSEANHLTGEVVETGRRGPRMSKILGFVP
jgi:dihydroxycyclohexadiene carboxylate dehydrogenase